MNHCTDTNDVYKLGWKSLYFDVSLNLISAHYIHIG